MAFIGRRIFYDKSTGNILVDTGEKRGMVAPTSVENDINSYKVLATLSRETFDYVDLAYGQFAEEFNTASGYRLNPETKALEFSLSEPETPPVYKPPLTEQLEALEASWMYDSMMKDLAIEEANATQADLMYQLMVKGVL